MKLRTILRRSFRRTGFDLVRYRPFLEFIHKDAIDLVIDVGANVGQFATEVREVGYRGRIVSFEPSARAFGELKAKSLSDPSWDVNKLALGSVAGTLDLNVYADTTYSSFHQLDGLSELAGKESVAVETLDTAAFGLESYRRVFLKLDTQGHDLPVLQGARQFLDRVEYIQTELSFSPIYDSQPTYLEVCRWLEEAGFQMWSTRRGAFNSDRLQEVERDALFRKRKVH